MYLYCICNSQAKSKIEYYYTVLIDISILNVSYCDYNCHALKDLVQFWNETASCLDFLTYNVCFFAIFHEGLDWKKSWQNLLLEVFWHLYCFIIRRTWTKIYSISVYFVDVSDEAETCWFSVHVVTVKIIAILRSFVKWLLQIAVTIFGVQFSSDTHNLQDKFRFLHKEYCNIHVCFHGLKGWTRNLRNF